MKAVVQPFDDPSLEEGVASLRIRAYPQFPETRDIEFYSSAYRWLKSHPLGEALHRWVAVTGGGEVVGHLAAAPQYYRIGGQRVVAYTPCDYMVYSQHAFQAFSLMRTFFISHDARGWTDWRSANCFLRACKGAARATRRPRKVVEGTEGKEFSAPAGARAAPLLLSRFFFASLYS